MYSPDVQKHFNEQYSAKWDRIPFGLGFIEAVQVNPLQQTHSRKILGSLGWGTMRGAHEPGFLGLVDQGFSIIAFEQPRWASVPLPESNFHPDVHRRALVQLAVLDHFLEPGESADVTAQSASVLDSLTAVRIAPDRFNNFVFFAPTGIVPPHSPGNLITRFFQNCLEVQATPIEDPELKAFAGRAGMEVLKYFFANPYRALKEVEGISGSYLTPAIPEIRAMGKKVSVIANVDDLVVDMDQLQSQFAQLDGFVSLERGHTQILFDCPRYMRWVGFLLRQMEANAN